jgi:hypothetical protein
MKLYIWEGLISAVPGTETYSETIKNSTASSGDSVIPLNAYLNDYISLNHTPQNNTVLTDSDRGIWFLVTVEYATADPSDTGVLYSSAVTFAGQGYSYGYETENLTDVPGYIALDGREFKVSRSSNFIVPIYCPNEDLEKLSIYSYPNNEISANITKTITTDSSGIIQLLNVDCSQTSEDATIEILYGDGGETLIELEIVDEQRYTPVEIIFVNRYGQDQSITFFKERNNKVGIENESYKNRGDASNVGKHQTLIYNPNGSQSFKVTSGWVPESYNETLQQLLLSKRCWERIGDTILPLECKTTSLNFLTQTNNDLIQYSLDFEYAFDLINTK